MKIQPLGGTPAGSLSPEPPAAAPAGNAPKGASTGAPPSFKQIALALERINATLKAMSSDVKFTFDAAARESVVQVVDPQTNKVIQQIPSQDALAIAQALDQLQGLLISERA